MRALTGTAVAALLGASLSSCGARILPARGPHTPVTIAARVLVTPTRLLAEPDPFASLEPVIADALAEGKLPGCVVVVGRHDEVLLRRAYGSRAVLPERLPMTLDTVFDLASLTKPIATSASVMILVERGKVDLEAPAARYVPELRKLPAFTVRQLLVHTSGLPAATSLADYSLDRAGLMRRFAELHLSAQPGERFLYSDVGFVILEEIVRRISGEGLDTFAAREVFEPLGMAETGYRPPEGLRERAAPTEPRDGAFLRGDVHDPRAFALGGVAGHAGLFSTADDLARFAQAMLGRGGLGGRRFVSDGTFAAWTARQETSKGGRALGWDLDSTFATHRSALLSPRAFGHGGYTGTALWIDPDKDLFVLFLSNRVHPDGKGAVNPLVAEIATRALRAVEVRTGIDALVDDGFERLRGAHVGLVTNASARAKDGTTTIDAIRAAPGVELKAIFTPEHGLSAEREGRIDDASHAGVPLYSLYGTRFSPTADTLDGIDTIVVDLQDVGARFYTYASTMERALKVAAERKIRFVVLDRPNPLGGLEIAGPVVVPRARAAPSGNSGASLVNAHALPVRHGMTMGELARLFVEDDHLEVDLAVVPLQGWRRKDYMDRTGLAWVSPSPNLRSVDEVVLYPAVGLLEATNLSVGRGTDTPFEVLGAPWLDAEALASRVSAAGIALEATEFTPHANPYAGQKCRGVQLRVTDRAAFEPVRTGLAIALALRELHADKWELDKLDRMLQNEGAMTAIRAGKSIPEIEATWAADLAAFRAKRDHFLLYR